MGPKSQTRQWIPGLGPTVRTVDGAVSAGRDRGPADSGPRPATGRDVPGVWRQRRRHEVGKVSRTTVPPARSRKHRKR